MDCYLIDKVQKAQPQIKYKILGIILICFNFLGG